MSLDEIFLEIAKSGGISGVLIAGALLYLGTEVRRLGKTMDRILPMLEDHGDRIATLEGRYKTWEIMRDSHG